MVASLINITLNTYSCLWCWILCSNMCRMMSQHVYFAVMLLFFMVVDWRNVCVVSLYLVCM